MHPLLAVLVFLMLLALVVPPVLLLASLANLHRKARWSLQSRPLIACTAAALLVVGFNSIFLMTRLGSLISGSFQTDGYLMFALTLSWFSFFGRMALRYSLRRKRRYRQSRSF